MDYTNRQIGNYRALAKIGKGGFSEIWRAQSVNDQKNRNYAIKIMDRIAAKKKENTGMFKREWKIVSELEHPNIVKYYDFGCFNGLPFMVMELFESETLRQAINNKNPMLINNGCEIVAKAAEGLRYLHSKGIIHRDIKPENILMNKEGDVRLIDFSLAQTKWQRILNFSKQIEGTPTYLAPEQLSKRKSLPASDVYALGVVLYEIYSGRPPFVGNTDNELMNSKLKGSIKRLSKYNRDISQKLDRLVANMLAKEPESRPDCLAGGLVNKLRKMEAFV